MLTYTRVGVTVKSGLDDKCESVDTITGIITNAGAKVFMDPKRSGGIECATNFPLYTSEDDIDLLVVIGGDGTILRTVRELKRFNVPILSVNKGTVGFLAEMNFHESITMIPKLLRGEGIIDERTLLHVRAYRDDHELFAGAALNEAVIAQGIIARIVDLKTSVNGEPLTSFHADGLIISTPTGSTAYSLAAGGPIVHPNLCAIILTPINPHSFTQKPVVISSDATVEIEVRSKESKFQDANVILTIDGQKYVPLERGDRVVITNDQQSVKFLRRKQDSFFGTLRTKLKWGERLE